MLYALCASNTPLNSANEICLHFERASRVSIGDPSALCQYYDDLLEFERNKIANLVKNSFVGYSVIADGSPYHCEAELVILRLVTFLYEIKEFVLHVSMLTKSPNAKTLGQSLLSALYSIGGLKVKDLRAIMLDRAATNGAMVNWLNATMGMNVLNAKCTCHTVVKVGEKFKGEELKQFISALTTMFQFPGCARILFKEVFNERVRRGGGCRWWVSLEQMLQLQHIGGLEVIMEKVVTKCLENKWSNTSALKFKELFNNPTVLARATVQLAAQCDAGLIFCITTYYLEGKGPMIFVAHSLLKRFVCFLCFLKSNIAHSIMLHSLYIPGLSWPWMKGSPFRV